MRRSGDVITDGHYPAGQCFDYRHRVSLAPRREDQDLGATQQRRQFLIVVVRNHFDRTLQGIGECAEDFVSVGF